ncbi:hypothetical protein LOTGIDRAFT_239554 [Lottia gigantea]|uniref:Apple domain-containing protein n=1 Tax=Lottia gigantea TaxID=225164 RepID=V4A8U0_LOTGI|nr:hypothetical protein LOTGIDRAFT_239554 [Lottia gigantea]ESO93177.1 hypothetical protein LOTGIDRAFT_239554 [Lottia gigantea]
MNNLLCSVFLLAVTTLILIDADCSTYPDVKNAYFNKDDNCVDVSVTCNEGFNMKQLISCIDGEWKYQEPYCEPQDMTDCDYKYTNDTIVHTGYPKNLFSVKQTECNERCNTDTQCSTFVVTDIRCVLYSPPVIAVLFNPIDGNYLNQCISNCSETKECLMFNYRPGGAVFCLLYNVTLDDLSDGDTIRSNEFLVAEKTCQ